jgi:hypothetical protein
MRWQPSARVALVALMALPVACSSTEDRELRLILTGNYEEEGSICLSQIRTTVAVIEETLPDGEDPPGEPTFSGAPGSTRRHNYDAVFVSPPYAATGTSAGGGDRDERVHLPDGDLQGCEPRFELVFADLPVTTDQDDREIVTVAVSAAGPGQSTGLVSTAFLTSELEQQGGWTVSLEIPITGPPTPIEGAPCPPGGPPPGFICVSR